MWQIGIVVPDQDAAMATMSDVFGVSWVHATRHLDIMNGDDPQTLDLEIALSQQGPVTLELIGAVEGSPWFPGHGLDHVAYWADDLAGTAATMESVGFRREATYQGEGGPVGFAYHRAPSGLRVEHVDASRRAAMMAWIAGGAYPDIRGGGEVQAMPEATTDESYARGGPAIGSAFHIGAVVVDLDRGMAELSTGLGFEWHTVQERTMHVRTIDGIAPVSLRFTYSKQTPHIELLQGDPGSIWGPEHAGIHHIGVWSDDLDRDAEALAAAGFGMEVTLASRSTDGPSGFTYQRSELGVRIELVPTSSRAAFDNWFGGGDFG